MTKIKMKALQYQSVPQGNEKQYVDTEGEFYVFSEQEALARVERRLAERISPEASEEESAAADSGETETDDLSKPWGMQVSPETYLAKWPDGQHAEHAKAVIERQKTEDGGKGGDGKKTGE